MLLVYETNHVGSTAMSESSDRRSKARQLAEDALRAQAVGDTAAADRLFTDGQRIDPEAVAEVLAEHDAAHEPDARDQRTFDRDRPEQHADAQAGVLRHEDR